MPNPPRPAIALHFARGPKDGEPERLPRRPSYEIERLLFRVPGLVTDLSIVDEDASTIRSQHRLSGGFRQIK
jgi:hypothetical protein